MTRAATGLMIAALCVGVPVHAGAQAAVDSAAAARARADARRVPVGLYVMGGGLAGPLTLAGLVGVAGPGEAELWMAVGPAALLGLARATSRSALPLPDSIRVALAEEPAAGRAVYERAWDEAVRRRRRAGLLIGASVGTVVTLLLLVYGNFGGA